MNLFHRRAIRRALASRSSSCSSSSPYRRARGALVPRCKPPARRRAARTCANNMRQFGLAAHNYESTFKVLAAGQHRGRLRQRQQLPAPWADPQRACCPWGHFSWSAIILPFVEQQGLYDSIDFSRLAYASTIIEHNGGNQAVSSIIDRGPIGDLVNQPAAQNMPKIFMCPSARVVVGVRKEHKDYAINGGSGGCCPERNNGTNATLNGVASAINGVRLAEITDGTSNTFLFLEAAHFKNQSWLPALRGSNPFLWVHHASQGYVQVQKRRDHLAAERHAVEHAGGRQQPSGRRPGHDGRRPRDLRDEPRRFLQHLPADLHPRPAASRRAAISATDLTDAHDEPPGMARGWP